MGPVLEVWEDKPASTAVAKHLVNRDGPGDVPLDMQRDISRTCIPLVYDDAPCGGPLVTPHFFFTISLVSKRGTKVAL